MKAWILGAAAAAAAAVAAPAAAQQYVMDFTISGYGSGTANFSTSGDASAGLTGELTNAVGPRWTYGIAAALTLSGGLTAWILSRAVVRQPAVVRQQAA